jgi:hypothetical protein
MSVSNDGRRADRKLPIVVLSLFTLFVGLMGLYRVMQSPQFESYRTVDVIQLTGSGVCFGVTMMGLVMVFVRSRLLNHHQKRTIRETEEVD